MKPKSLAGLKRTNNGFKSEDRVVKDMGMRTIAGSGNQAGNKSDGVDKEYRLECKSTEKKSIRLEHDWLLKIAHEALETGRTPLLAISFVFEQGKPKKEGDWVMMRKRDFDELTGRDE
jgi:hypothetical protein